MKGWCVLLVLGVFGVLAMGGQLVLKDINPDVYVRADLDERVGVGRFQAFVQVPTEPVRKGKQTIVYHMGVAQDRNFRGFGVVRAGVAMVWDAQNHWRVIAAAKACSSTGYPCKLLWEDDAVLRAEPGDLVFLNVTGVPGQPYAGYEVSLPYKTQKTVFSTAYPLEQTRVTGTFGDVYELNVDNCDKLPTGTSNILQVAYTSANNTKEIPLRWFVGNLGYCLEGFVAIDSPLIRFYWHHS